MEAKSLPAPVIVFWSWSDDERLLTTSRFFLKIVLVLFILELANSGDLSNLNSSLLIFFVVAANFFFWRKGL